MRRTFALLIALPAAVALPAAADPDCYCTDGSGSRVEMGETVCLTVDGRAYLARCEMSLNSPMWRDTGAACVTSRLERPRTGLQRSDPGIALR